MFFFTVQEIPGINKGQNGYDQYDRRKDNNHQEETIPLKRLFKPAAVRTIASVDSMISNAST